MEPVLQLTGGIVLMLYDRQKVALSRPTITETGAVLCGSELLRSKARRLALPATMHTVAVFPDVGSSSLSDT